MKYWMRDGDYGTMDDDGYVPDSVEIDKAEYDDFVIKQPIIEQVNEIVKYEDVETGKILKLRKVK